MIYQNNTFIGREDELSVLEKCYASNGFQFITITGRDGIGKTALIREFCKGKKAILFSAIKSDAVNNLKALSRAVSKSLYREVRDLVTFKSMDSALEFIHRLAEKGREVVVIDNYDDLVSSIEGLPELIKTYLSHIFPKRNIMLILTGSKQFMDSQTFGMDPVSIHLENLSFSEVRDSFRTFQDYDLVTLYAMTGGNPNILRHVDPDRSIRDNIDSLCLSSDGIMFDLPLRRMMSHLRSPEAYCSLLTAISGGLTPMKDIVSRTSMGSSAACSTYLSNLVDIGIVEKEVPFHERNSRKGLYRISDIPTAFWTRFIQGNQSLIEFRGDEDLYGKIVEKGLEQHMQQVFREICVMFIKENPSLLDIDPGNIGRWWGQGDSGNEFIDIVVESNDRMTTLFCDCRFRDSPVSMSVLNELKRKSERLNVFGRRTYALFSMVGFTSDLNDISDEDDVFLFDLSDICWY